MRVWHGARLAAVQQEVESQHAALDGEQVDELLLSDHDHLVTEDTRDI